MATISLLTCADGDSQTWDVKADGRIALAASSPRKCNLSTSYHGQCSKPRPLLLAALMFATEECIDLQYMLAKANNPVGLYSCAGLGNIGAADKGINWPLANATA